GVDDQPAAGAGGVPQPALPGRQGTGVRQEQGADRLGPEEGVQDAVAGAVGHQDRFAGHGGQPGGAEFTPHAARAQGAAAGAGLLQDGPVDVRDGGHQGGAGVLAGVGGVEPVHRGQQDQERSPEQVGDQGGQVVVVAEADLG